MPWWAFFPVMLVTFFNGQYYAQRVIGNYYIRKAQDYQRRGIGTELLSLAVEWLCAQGASSMMVGFHHDNPYRDFYLKHGGVLGAPSRCEWRDLEALRSSLQIHP